MDKFYLNIDKECRPSYQGYPCPELLEVEFQQKGALSAWQGFLELLMPEKNRKKWSWFFSLKEGTVKYKKGISTEGIHFIALEISAPNILTITLFLYSSSPSGKLNFYCPLRGNTCFSSMPIEDLSELDVNTMEIADILIYNLPPRTYSIRAYKAMLYKKYVRTLIKEIDDKKFTDIYKYPYIALLRKVFVFGPKSITIKEKFFEYNFKVVSDFWEMLKEFDQAVYQPI